MQTQFLASIFRFKQVYRWTIGVSVSGPITVHLSKLTRLPPLTYYTSLITKWNPPSKGPLITKALQEAEQNWTYNNQSITYAKQIANPFAESSRLIQLVRQLRLFLDERGLLRCGGSIHNALMNMFPYLFPTKHPFTNLFIQEVHNNQLHTGVNSTVTALRQKFWVPAAHQIVRSLLPRCVECRKIMGKADPPPLTKSRIRKWTPFTVTRAPFTGTLYVKIQGSEENVYICMFTCAVPQAVHLELEVVGDLIVESFIQAFRRFASRKSLLRKMKSDNEST